MPKVFVEHAIDPDDKLNFNGQIDAVLHNKAKAEARRRRRASGEAFHVQRIYEEALELYFKTLENRRR